MATTTVETIAQTLPALTLRNRPDQAEPAQSEYRYANLLPHFSPNTYPPLEPFTHHDPGLHALTHPNPRAFLDRAESVVELTPRLGTEVRGVNLSHLGAAGRDQLALEVTRFTFFMSEKRDAKTKNTLGMTTRR